MAKIIDGKKISLEIKDEVKNEVAKLLEKGIVIEDTREGVKWKKA